MYCNSCLSCLAPPPHCMYSQVDQFLESLIKFDKENIADPTLKAVRPYLENKEFDPDFIRSKSAAAAGTCMRLITAVLGSAACGHPSMADEVLYWPKHFLFSG